ncbi:sugar O-acetyltransferase [Anopheles sinensis]|uniref:Sugar O-acetyltransferase n=1 Tax=Anopheles sinensis TaxID=74873 RepID=A0A084VEU7_ANOSI|nr:sugar O-acetyltransferase [Anopheles sinensis]
MLHLCAVAPISSRKPWSLGLPSPFSDIDKAERTNGAGGAGALMTMVVSQGPYRRESTPQSWMGEGCGIATTM